MKMKRVLITVLCFMLLSMVCTLDMSGGSTESTNQVVVGMVYEPDGKTPAEGAVVIIRSQNTLAAIEGVTAEKQNSTKDTAVTDNSGRYAFREALDNDLYSFEAIKDDNAVFINPVNVAYGEDTVEMDPVTLRPTGRIIGGIFLAEGGDPTEVYVLAFGIDRFTRVDSDGQFTFSGLGEGEYYLKIITTLDIYGSFDTAWIPVVASETTDLGTITLPFSGLPVPQNVKVTYDPGPQKATISWDRAERPGVKYYNIYRGYASFSSHMPITTSVRLNGYQIIDTFYVDSTIGDVEPIMGLPAAVAYSVSVVDSAENEGEKSTLVEVSTSPSITIVNETNLLTANRKNIDFTVARNGEIYIACDGDPFLYVLDSTFNYKEEFHVVSPFNPDSSAPLSFTLRSICSDGTSELLYITRSDDEGIFIYGYDGLLIDSIEDPTAEALGVTDLEIIHNSLHVLTGDSVISFDNNGNRKAAWDCVNGRCLADGGAGRVVVGGYGQICWHDSVGTIISSMQVEYNPLSIAIDTMRQYLYVLIGDGLSFKLLIYDSTNVKIYQYVHHLEPHVSSNKTMRLLGNGNPLVMHVGKLLELSVLKK
ncbi:MAG: hypothetical protein JXA18_11285 [Chitinispirillaceae bacterium]|nr:hypothetical protein [Chitinispirillaceae bacterium]